VLAGLAYVTLARTRQDVSPELTLREATTETHAVR